MIKKDIWKLHVEAVNDVLKIRGMTRYQLAKALNGKMSGTFLYNYLRGGTGISGEKIAAINEVLGIRFTCD